ncbi:3-oxoacyl-[acyl-carrier-protein] synthase 2 [bacterium BMS3Bbin10]|nr:3-oxoacyl-[acyl-carrier-protein] synthase 2 [bacterium BMS3Bbin10]
MENRQMEEVWITGIGLVSSLGEGCEDHWRSMGNGGSCEPVVDAETFAPYAVHPLGEVDFSSQVPKRGDLRQMGPWQRLGTYTAGLALSDAGVAGDPAYLNKMDMIIAADGGERDIEVDIAVLEGIGRRNDPEVFLNEALSTQLRPTLFLAQLPNLMAGNISIVHKVCGSSRTFMGEEMAGVSAAQIAVKKIRHGQSELCLIGGAYNAERDDMQFAFELGHYLWPGEFEPLWERRKKGGGIVNGSVGAFLVLESKSHATARGARAYAQLSEVLADRCDRAPGAAARNAREQFDALGASLEPGPLAVLSGACGAEPVTGEERAFLEGLSDKGFDVSARAVSSMLGHSVEAQFLSGLALAAIAASKKQLFGPVAGSDFEKPYDGCPDRILVTSWGHWRGEGMALVETLAA